MPSLQAKVGRPADYAKALIALTDVICRTLWKSNGTKACRLHRMLFESINPKAVVSFNYDLIADQTLVAMRRLAWHREEYAGGGLKIRQIENKGYTRARPVRKMPKAVPLLKLHGSMNW